MNVPNEAKTRAYFEQIDYHLSAIDPNRGEEAVRFHRGEPNSGSYVSYPSLRQAWKGWAKSALHVRCGIEFEEAVVDRWVKGDAPARRAIEEWVDRRGASEWSGVAAALEVSVPSRRFSPICMPKGWRQQFLRDFRTIEANLAVRSVHDRIGLRLRAEGCVGFKRNPIVLV